MTFVICLNGIIDMVLNYKIIEIGMYYVVITKPNNDGCYTPWLSKGYMWNNTR